MPYIYTDPKGENDYIIIKRDQSCPVCGGHATAHKMLNPWNDWLCVCDTCGFSYSELGDFGDTEEDAKLIWDYDVQFNGLESVALTVKENEIESKKWKEKREWFLQQNKNKD